MNYNFTQNYIEVVSNLRQDNQYILRVIFTKSVLFAFARLY